MALRCFHIAAGVAAIEVSQVTVADQTAYTVREAVVLSGIIAHIAADRNSCKAAIYGEGIGNFFQCLCAGNDIVGLDVAD